MLNTDFFDFEFVDRKTERDIIYDFSDFSIAQISKKTLWIKGKHGVGKTFLLNNVYNKLINRNKYVVYTTVEKNNIQPGVYLKNLLLQTEKVSGFNIFQFINKHYKEIIRFGPEIIKIVLDSRGLDDHGIVDLLAELSGVLISKNNDEDSYIEAIQKYIEKSIGKKGEGLFIFDNFSLCDEVSAEKIIQLIHIMNSFSKIRFIICTTEEDICSRNDIKEALSVRIPTFPLVISEFKEESLFARMVEKCIDLNSENLGLIRDAFHICKGYPQKYKAFLINLYSEQGIVFENDQKASFIRDIFKEILARESTSIDINSLTYQQQYILKIIFLWNDTITFEVLKEFLLYEFNISPYNTFTQEAFLDAVRSLMEIDILHENYIGERSLGLKHDTISYTCQVYFSNEIENKYEHFNIYSFLRQTENNNDYYTKHVESLLAYHSFQANTDDWIEINFKYAKKLYMQGNYREAGIIGDRFVKNITSLSFKKAFMLAQIEFVNGQYDYVVSILEKYISDLSQNKEYQVEFYLLLAKAYTCKLEIEKALDIINYASDLNSVTLEDELKIRGKKQSILFVSPKGFMSAKKEFDNLTKKYHNIELPEMIQIYASAMDYYEGSVAIEYLEKGYSIAILNNDKLSEGKLLNNIAFEKLRLSEYDVAEKKYTECIELIKNIQPHEQSYPLNNLAVIHMIREDWENALDYIIEAIFWNRSYYVMNVLQVNRMLCYYHTENQKWKEVFKQLKEFVNSKKAIDDKIYKKILINLAYISLLERKYDEAISFLDMYKPYSQMEWQQGLYRYKYLEAQAKGIEINLPSIDKYQDYYCKINFEPWLVNFTHD